MTEGTGYSLSDIVSATRGGDGFFGGNGGMFALLFLILIMGNGSWGASRGAFGTEAIQNQMQQGFDNQNNMANQREILNATNQVFHDTLNVIRDKYSELARDVYGVSGQVAQVMANQNQCCCDTKMLIQETSAQNRYDALKNTNDINAVTIGQTQKILDALSQNKIEALQEKVQQLSLAQNLNNVVRYPTSMSYNAGQSPFCNCNGCGCYA